MYFLEYPDFFIHVGSYLNFQYQLEDYEGSLNLFMYLLEFF